MCWSQNDEHGLRRSPILALCCGKGSFCSVAVCSIGILPLQASHTNGGTCTPTKPFPGLDACWLHDLSLSVLTGTAEVCVGYAPSSSFYAAGSGLARTSGDLTRNVQLQSTLQGPLVAAPARRHASALCCAAAAVHTFICLAQQSGAAAQPPGHHHLGFMRSG